MGVGKLGSAKIYAPLLINTHNSLTYIPYPSSSDLAEFI